MEHPDFIPKKTISIALMPALDDEFTPYLAGNAILVNDRLLKEDCFTSRIIKKFEAKISDKGLIREEITGKVPDVIAGQLAHLDQRGIAKTGATLKKGDIIIGKVSPKSRTELPPEEMLLHAIFGRVDFVKDTSIEMPYTDGGIVTAADYKQNAKGVIESATVSVAIRKHLGIGDVLRDESGNCGVVARFFTSLPVYQGLEEIDAVAASSSAFLPNIKDSVTKSVWRIGDDDDLYLYPPDIKTPEQLFALRNEKSECQFMGQAKIGHITLEKTTNLVEEKIMARSSGPYGIISQQPLATDRQTGYHQPARITEAEISALENYPAIINDALTTRSDAVKKRLLAVEELINKGTFQINDQPPGVTDKPANLESVILYLKALCLDAGFENGQLIIQPASSAQIRFWSSGQVKKPETINWRTWRPEMDGLFDERIFGPEIDWQCNCGKYKGVKYKGVRCDRCGVEITTSDARHKRIGHIELAVEAVHPYFQDYFAGLLNISRPAAKSAIYYKGEGGAALNKFIGQLRKETQPDWMILKNIPVLPPGLRPIVYTADRGVVSSDLNELYKNLIKANNKLLVLKKAKAPSVIIQHASRLLQRAIDHLFWNGYGGAASVTDYLNDELGKFWMKYCDYSGLANVAPDVALGKDECGLRRDALVELYQPLVIWRLKSAGIADRIKSARKLIEDYQRGVSLYEEIITEELEKAIASRPLIITCGNRVTALWPKIRPYEAIGINPEMCRALGLALDGRKVGIHLPLAEDAVIEAKSFIGRVLEGTGEIASVFSGLFTCTAERQRSPAPAGSPSERVDNSPKPLIDAVIAGKSLPLSKLDRYIVS